MPIIYNVSIESTGVENRFRIAWKNTENNKVYSFEEAIGITPEETQWLWQLPRHRQIIGRKLFRFLDGEEHHFQQALEHAHRLADTLQVNLQTCKETNDWPFEVLVNNKTFLLSRDIHLVRFVPGREEKAVFPKNRPLKLLFMACSIMDVRPELDFEKEEEAIFQITDQLPIDMEVEDSGSLEGLSSKLAQEEYDVVHLSGHAGIDKNGTPYFIMEDDTGGEQQVFPDQLWNKALKRNPPRLVVLSGSRTGETPGLPDMSLNTAEGSFASMLVGNYNVPAVLGWGRKVNDDQAIHAGTMLFLELSKGRSIPDALQRARYELIKKFFDSDKPAWPLLRLYAGDIPLNAIVKEEQQKKPKSRRMTHIYLKNSRVKVLEEGFVGRRRQLQRSLRGLKAKSGKVGLLILGTGGLGKSCLAGKICERFSNYTLIIIEGRLNTISLEKALKDSFIINQDDKGKEILAQKKEMTDKLTHLCSTSFKERNYLFLLDDFEKNMEGFEKGKPGELYPEAADLLRVLLHYLPLSGRMSHVIVTSRYEFPLQHQEYDIAKKRLEKIWLTGFSKTEQRKKSSELKNIFAYEDREISRQLLAAGHGNPRLMEWIDLLVGQKDNNEIEQLAAAVADKQEEFICEHVIRELLKKGGPSLERFLRWFSIYRMPVLEEGVSLVAKKAGVKGWKKLLHKGMSLSLAEHDQARESYQVTPLLREELLEGVKDHLPCHEAAFAYFKQICEVNESIDPVLREEWIYHALGCGEEDVASGQGSELVLYLQEQLALAESRRVGEWILAMKKNELFNEYDGSLLNALGYTIHEIGDNLKAIDYYLQAFKIRKKIYGENHPQVAIVLNNIGEGWRVLGEHSKAIEHYQMALHTWINFYGKNNIHTCSLSIAGTMNNLGLAWKALGNHRKAIDYFEKTLAIWEKIYGEKHQNLAIVMNNLGTAWHDLGNPGKAINYYLQALKIDERFFGREHPNVARELNNLGDSYYTLGDYVKAIDYFEQARIIDEAVLGRQHPDIARDLSNLGSAHYKLGYLHEAVDYFEKALSIEEAAFGRKHPNVAIRLNNLGEVWRVLGDLQKAVDYFKQALDIDEAVVGKEHSEFALHLSNLGSTYHMLGNYQQAIDCFNQAHDIDKAVFGLEHPSVARDLNNLGEARRVMGEPRRAIECFEQALTIDEAVFGQGHPHTASHLNNLGLSWKALGDNLKAISYFEQALDIWKEKYGEMNPQLAAPMNNIGSTWRALGEPEKAIDYFEKSLTILKKVYGDEHLQLAVVVNNLGSALNAMGKHRKAISCYKQALTIWKKVYGDNHPHLAAAMNNLGMTHVDLGESKKAKEYFEMAYNLFNEFHGSSHKNTKTAKDWLDRCTQMEKQETEIK